MFRKDHPVLEELLDGLFHIAKADGGVHDAEIAFLKSVANIFGLDENDFARLREGHLGRRQGRPLHHPRHQPPGQQRGDQAGLAQAGA